MTDFLQTASRSNGQDWINGLFQQQANMQAGSQLASGDRRGAAGTLYRAGNLDGGRILTTDADAAATKTKAEQLATTQMVVKALRAERDAGRDLSAALAAYRPTLLAMGTDAGQLATIEQQVLANPAFLEQIDAITAEQMKWELRAGANGDTVAVGLDPTKGTTQSRLAYAAPARPEITQFGILNAPDRALPEGQMTGYQPGTSTAQPPILGSAISDAPLFTPGSVPLSGPPPAPPSGPAPLDTMEAITAQSESGTRERDANGRLITSPVGAQGMMQVMPGTNRDPGYGVTPARDNSDAERTRVGRDYLAAMMREYGNDPAKAWAAYNWGPGNLDRAIARNGGDWLSAAPAETQAYVAKNLRALNGADVAQGDDAIDEPPQSGPVALGGGYTLTPMETPAARAAAEQREYQRQRDAQQDRRYETQSQRANDAADRTATREERMGRDQLYQRFTANKDVARFVETDSAYRDLKALAADNSGVNDVALTFGIMRMVQADGSVVREGEFALLGAAAGIPESVIRMVQRARNGESLTPEQRRQVVAAADTLHRTRLAKHNEIASQFREYAEQDGYDPNRVARLAGDSSVPRVRFEPTEAQRSWYATNGRPQARAPAGSRGNPRMINPADPTSSYANVPSGAFYVTPDGQLRGPKR